MLYMPLKEGLCCAEPYHFIHKYDQYHFCCTKFIPSKKKGMILYLRRSPPI